MTVRKLQGFLDSHNVKYVKIIHSPAYTAQKNAASAHIPGKALAKTVMVKIDGKMAMAVLPASKQVDFKLLREATGRARWNWPGSESSWICSRIVILGPCPLSAIFMTWKFMWRKP